MSRCLLYIRNAMEENLIWNVLYKMKTAFHISCTQLDLKHKGGCNFFRSEEITSFPSIISRLWSHIWKYFVHYDVLLCERYMPSMYAIDEKKMFQHFITWRLMTHNILQNAKSKEMGERETPSCASNYGNYGTHSCLIVQLKRRAECWSSVFYSSIHGVRLQQR